MSNELVNASLKAKKVSMAGGRTDGAYVEEYEAVGGLTIRDYFAARAMQAIIADPYFSSKASQMGYDEFASELAEEVYVVADAMMLRRSV